MLRACKISIISTSQGLDGERALVLYTLKTTFALPVGNLLLCCT